MKHFKILFLIFITTSCACNKNGAEKILKTCINNKINRSIKEAYGKPKFDFYDFIMKMENILKENKLLKNTHRQSYLALLKQIIDNDRPEFKRVFIQQERLMDKYGFTPYFTEVVFNSCPYIASYSDKEGEGKNIYNQGVILNKMMAQGFNNKKLLTQLINIVDEKTFRNKLYKAPVILLVMINLDLKYNENLNKLQR